MDFRQGICVTPEDHSSRSGCEGSLPQELPTMDTAYSVKDLKVRRADCLKGRVTPGFVSRPFFVGTHEDVSCRDPCLSFFVHRGHLCHPTFPRDSALQVTQAFAPLEIPVGIPKPACESF